MKQLWNQGWVAETEAEALDQAERMFDLFHGRRVAVDRLTFPYGGDYDEWMFAEPWPEVWVTDLSTENGWDGSELLPEWDVRVADPEQVCTTMTGLPVTLGALEDRLTTTAPAIGTEAGFGGAKDGLVFPLSRPAAGVQETEALQAEGLRAAVIEAAKEWRALHDPPRAGTAFEYGVAMDRLVATVDAFGTKEKT